jgi:CheY-like chemotaxis protein
MSGTLRLLLIEDSRSDAALTVHLLEKAGYTVVSERVEDAAELSAALTRQAWDIVICDYHLPQLDAPTALRIFQQTGTDIPFIVISGGLDEDASAGIVQSGANDFLSKNDLARLAPAVEHQIKKFARRRELRRSGEARRAAST